MPLPASLPRTKPENLAADCGPMRCVVRLYISSEAVT